MNTLLTSFLDDVLEVVEPLFRGTPVQIQAQIDPELPVMLIDRTRIRQVLLNLISNARRFTEAGYVRLEAHHSGQFVTISVMDTGSGIPAEKLPYVFDEFYQVDYSLNRQHGGMGLGLALSKRFIEAHGGYIHVESTEGAGSAFVFNLPVRTIEPARARQVVQSERRDTDVQPGILVITYDPAVITVLRHYFSNFHLIQVTKPVTSKR